MFERDLKAVVGKRLDSQERSGLATAQPPEHASAQRELNRLGLLILRLHYEKAIAGVLHDLYTNPSVRQLRIDTAAEIPTCILGKALACTEGALSSIQDALGSESHRILTDAKQVPNLGEDLERLKAVAQSLATLADGNSAQERAELRRITRYFGSTLRDWRDRLNRDAEQRWGELGLGDFGTKIQPFRPYLSAPYIAQFDKGYAELTGRPPLFEKCNLLAREHDLLEDVLKQFDMLQGELDIGDLDGDELGVRCDILKDSVAQAHSFWSQYFDLGGSREQWEDKLRSSGKYQWDIINRCQQEMAGAPGEGDASTGNLRFRERLRKAQRNLELHFGSVDNALAQAFGRIKEAIGMTLLTVELVA